MLMKLTKQKNFFFCLCEYMGPTSLLYISIRLCRVLFVFQQDTTRSIKRQRPYLVLDFVNFLRIREWQGATFRDHFLASRI